MKKETLFCSLVGYQNCQKAHLQKDPNVPETSLIIKTVTSETAVQFPGSVLQRRHQFLLILESHCSNTQKICFLLRREEIKFQIACCDRSSFVTTGNSLAWSRQLGQRQTSAAVPEQKWARCLYIVFTRNTQLATKIPKTVKLERTT